jgi:hypothetical protein
MDTNEDRMALSDTRLRNLKANDSPTRSLMAEVCSSKLTLAVRRRGDLEATAVRLTSAINGATDSALQLS